MKEDIRELTRACVHCIISRSGEQVRRPLSTALHDKKPNEVVHMDFLYMGPANENAIKYLLLIKDDVNSYYWLLPCSNADSEAVTSAISK